MTNKKLRTKIREAMINVYDKQYGVSLKKYGVASKMADAVCKRVERHFSMDSSENSEFFASKRYR